MKWILYFLMFVPAITIAQTDSLAPIEFTEVVTIDSATKVQLFEQGRRWFAATFGDSKSVLEISDKESGELTGKANFTFYHSTFNGLYDSEDVYSGIITFRISILFKEGKYKVTLSGYRHEGTHFVTVPNGIVEPVSIGPLYYKFVLHKIEKGMGILEKAHFKLQNEVYFDARKMALAKGPELLRQLSEFMKKGNYSTTQDW